MVTIWVRSFISPPLSFTAEASLCVSPSPISSISIVSKSSFPGSSSALFVGPQVLSPPNNAPPTGTTVLIVNDDTGSHSEVVEVCAMSGWLGSLVPVVDRGGSTIGGFEPGERSGDSSAGTCVIDVFVLGSTTTVSSGPFVAKRALWRRGPSLPSSPSGFRVTGLGFGFSFGMPRNIPSVADLISKSRIICKFQIRLRSR